MLESEKTKYPQVVSSFMPITSALMSGLIAADRIHEVNFIEKHYGGKQRIEQPQAIGMRVFF